MRGSRCPILRLIPEDGVEWNADASWSVVVSLFSFLLSLSCFLSPLLSYLLSSPLLSLLSRYGASSIQLKVQPQYTPADRRARLWVILDIQPSRKKHPSECLSKRCRASSETVGVALQEKAKKQEPRAWLHPGKGPCRSRDVPQLLLLPSADLCKRTSNAPGAIPLAGAHGCPWYLVPGCFWGGAS